MAQAIHVVVSGGAPISKNTTEGLKKQGGNDLPNIDFLPREFEIFIYLVNGENTGCRFVTSFT